MDNKQIEEKVVGLYKEFQNLVKQTQEETSFAASFSMPEPTEEDPSREKNISVLKGRVYQVAKNILGLINSNQDLKKCFSSLYLLNSSFNNKTSKDDETKTEVVEDYEHQ